MDYISSMFKDKDFTDKCVLIFPVPVLSQKCVLPIPAPAYFC